MRDCHEVAEVAAGVRPDEQRESRQEDSGDNCGDDGRCCRDERRQEAGEGRSRGSWR